MLKAPITFLEIGSSGICVDTKNPSPLRGEGRERVVDE
jgi:hypothetical protein